jgi:hypothetical protein
VRDQGVGGVWGRAALLAALVLAVSGCAATLNQQSQASPSASAPATPSESPSPSSSPTASSSGGALAIASATLHPGEVSLPYTPATLAASGGSTPYTWTISSGALPGGLSLSPDGSISGTPSAAGTFHFTFQVADSAGAKATVTRSLGIASALKASLLPACAQRCFVEQGCVVVCGAFASLKGGVGQHAYSLTGYLPPGTTLGYLALGGTFTTTGTFKFGMKFTDSLGATSTINPAFFVFPHMSFSGGTCTYLINNRLPCKVTLKYAGGMPGGHPSLKVVNWVGEAGLFCLTACPEPPMTAIAAGGSISITIGPVKGYPFVLSTGTFTVILTDQSLCAAGVSCSSKRASVILTAR